MEFLITPAHQATTPPIMYVYHTNLYFSCVIEIVDVLFTLDKYVSEKSGTQKNHKYREFALVL